MQVKITSEKSNPLLKRREITFSVEHGQTGSTPPRADVRKAVADALKVNTDLVFVRKFETRTGTHVALGKAYVYDSKEHAIVVEPEFIVKRYSPPEKPKEEEKEQQ